MGIIGIWKDDIKVDQAKFAEYADSGMDIQGIVVDMCPTSCITASCCE